jgi:manganese transport protein
MKFGFRKIEAIIFTLVITIFGCFVYEILISNPAWGSVLKGTFVPTMPNNDALLISLGILGATVMPHNLYLHSSIVQTRKIEPGEAGIREAIKFNRIDTIVALSFAFFVNAAILIVAASVFHAQGRVVEDLREGYELLNVALGGAAATAFAVALLASGQSSTVTGTLAGQIVMEGFMKWKIQPWVRRLATRLLAIIPAVAIINATNGEKTVEMLVISQVVLSMQLPFAIFPLIAITSDRAKMGVFTNAPWVKWLGFVLAGAVGGLNVYMLHTTFIEISMVHLAGFYCLLLAGLLFTLWVKFLYKPKAQEGQGS